MVPCGHYPRCFGNHCGGPIGPHPAPPPQRTWDISVQGTLWTWDVTTQWPLSPSLLLTSDDQHWRLFKLVNLRTPPPPPMILTSGGQDWWHVQTCSPEGTPPPHTHTGTDIWWLLKHWIAFLLYSMCLLQVKPLYFSCISGEHLRMCPQGFTCCSQDMEHKLSTQSRQEFDKIMADKIGLLRNTFVSRTAKFDGKFIAFIPIEIYLHVTPFSMCDLPIIQQRAPRINKCKKKKGTGKWRSFSVQCLWFWMARCNVVWLCWNEK